MRLFKPYKVLLILGNGFDLSLGLRTSYANFMDSELFKKWVKIRHYRNAKIDLHDKNLFNYLHLQKGLRNWIDVEEELKKYAANQRVEYNKDNGGLISTNNSSDGTINYSYTILCFALQTYIKSLDYTELNNKALSLVLLRTVMSKSNNDVVSFNYTDIKRLESKPRGNVEYMHGNTEDGIILGFQRFDNMAPGYEYMIKSEHPLYKSRHLSAKMLAADEIIIYGHSLGETDHCYFKPFFEEQISERAKPRCLTIFTLDQTSRALITQQMVALSDGKYQLFQDNTDVNVIETANNDKEVKAFIDGLKKRIKKIHLNFVR